MQKLLSIVIVAMFASVSFSAVAASHAGAMKDDKKMDKMDKMDKKHDKMDKKHDKMEKKMDKKEEMKK